jgi:hypothetical protein
MYELLTWSGFAVAQQADVLDAIAEALDADGVRGRLSLLAHLTVFTKQLDVMLTSDAVAGAYAEEFKKEYRS